MARRGKKQKSFIRILIILGIVIFVLFFLATLHKRSFSSSSSVSNYHGPNPNIKLTTFGQPELVLGRHTRYFGSILTVTPTPTPIPVLAAQASAKIEQYGIAAGGGLVGFSQNQLNTYFSNLKSLGVLWVRWDIDWGVVQGDGSAIYNWGPIDMVANTAKQYGINSLAIIDYTPKWAAYYLCNQSYGCAPADSKTFGIYAKAVATRYKGTINYFEIWNEENIVNSWNPRPSVNGYFNILKEAYTQIKAVNPQAFIITGGLAASADDSDGNLAPVTFMKQLYALGGSKYFDGVALHPYSYPATPNYVAPWNSWQQMSQVRSVMIADGDSAKKIWITEFGAPTSGPGPAFTFNQLDNFTYGSAFMTEAAQTEMLNEATTFYKQNTSWLGPFFWYSLQDNGTTKDTPENFFGIMRYDGSKKNAYSVFQTIIANSK